MYFYQEHIFSISCIALQWLEQDFLKTVQAPKLQVQASIIED